MDDTIKRGDRVSWQSSTGYEPRRFGRVLRICTKDFYRAYTVVGDDGVARVVPARFVTKEPQDSDIERELPPPAGRPYI